MTNYLYKGITTYVKRNNHAINRLEMIISALNTPINIDSYGQKEKQILNTNQHKTYQDIQESEAYNMIETLDYLCFVSSEYYPKLTPQEYKQIQIQEVEIKNNSLYRIYIPLVSQNNNDISTFTQAYIQIMKQLFKHDLISIMTKDSHQQEDFNESSINHIISPN